MATRRTRVRLAWPLLYCVFDSVLTGNDIAGKYGARIMRLTQVQDFSIHDIALVDGNSTSGSHIASI